MLVPGGPDAAFVVVRLRNADEAPFGLVQRLLVGVFVIGDANELAVGGEAPTMVRAGEYGRVALVVAADLHSAVPTGVEEYWTKCSAFKDAVLLEFGKQHFSGGAWRHPSLAQEFARLFWRCSIVVDALIRGYALSESEYMKARAGEYELELSCIHI